MLIIKCIVYPEGIQVVLDNRKWCEKISKNMLKILWKKNNKKSEKKSLKKIYASIAIKWKNIYFFSLSV